MTTSLSARPVRALLTLLVLTCLAAAATAQLARAAGRGVDCPRELPHG